MFQYRLGELPGLVAGDALGLDETCQAWRVEDGTGLLHDGARCSKAEGPLVLTDLTIRTVLEMLLNDSVCKCMLSISSIADDAVAMAPWQRTYAAAFSEWTSRLLASQHREFTDITFGGKTPWRSVLQLREQQLDADTPADPGMRRLMSTCMNLLEEQVERLRSTPAYVDERNCAIARGLSRFFDDIPDEDAGRIFMRDHDWGIDLDDLDRGSFYDRPKLGARISAPLAWFRVEPEDPSRTAIPPLAWADEVLLDPLDYNGQRSYLMKVPFPAAYSEEVYDREFLCLDTTAPVDVIAAALRMRDGSAASTPFIDLVDALNATHL